VSLQAVQAGEALAAHGTNIRSLSGVGAHVQGEEARLDEALFADVALEGPLPRVVPPVDLQLGGRPERLVAVVALERPLARVNQRVAHQGVLAEEALPAELAREAQPLVVEVVVLQEAPPRREGLAALRAGERRHGLLRYGLAGVVHALHVPRQRDAVPELLAALPAEERVRLGVLLLVLHQVRVRAEPLAAVGALERLVAGVLPLVPDEALEAGEGGEAVGAGVRLHGVVHVDVVLVEGLEHGEVLLAPVALERRVRLLVHRQRLRVAHQLHAHLAVQRVVRLLVGLQRRLVLERLVAVAAAEAVLHVLRLLRVHLLLVVADVSQVEAESLSALELDAAVGTVERTLEHALAVFRAFLVRLFGRPLVLGGAIGFQVAVGPLLEGFLAGNAAGRLLALARRRRACLRFPAGLPLRLIRTSMLLQVAQALVEPFTRGTGEGQLLRVAVHVALQELGSAHHHAAHFARSLVEVVAFGRGPLFGAPVAVLRLSRSPPLRQVPLHLESAVLPHRSFPRDLKVGVLLLAPRSALHLVVFVVGPFLFSPAAVRLLLGVVEHRHLAVHPDHQRPGLVVVVVVRHLALTGVGAFDGARDHHQVHFGFHPAAETAPRGSRAPAGVPGRLRKRVFALGLHLHLGAHRVREAARRARFHLLVDDHDSFHGGETEGRQDATVHDVRF